MDYWDTRLTYVITPKSGPLRRMVRLRDAKQALADLPPGYLERVQWLRAWRALLAAAETGTQRDIEWAFEKLVGALDEEGWLTRGGLTSTPTKPLRSEPPRYVPPPSVVPSNVRASVGNITPRRAAEPLWRRIGPVSTDRRTAEGQQRASASLNSQPKDLEQFVREHLLFLPGSDG